MLKELTIKNFKSIHSEITFSMEADLERVSEFKEHVEDINGNNLLKVASMYGPNGGGKTNILLALQLASMIVKGNSRMGFTDNNIAFGFANDKVTSETLFFVTEKYEIGYQFDIVHNISVQESIDFIGNKASFNVSSFDIKKEIITYKESNGEYKVLLERDEKGQITSEALDKIGLNYAKIINGNLSALTYLYNTFVNVTNINHTELDVIMHLYQEIINIYNLEVTGVNYNVAFNAIKANKEKLIKLLNAVDIKISDIVVAKNNKNSPIQFERNIEVDGKYEKRCIPLSSESKGTVKIFWMFLNLLNEINKNHIYYCDDMNAFLHPKLFKAIIELFNSEDNKTNQLIFNSHDIINMTNDLFRRDEIWFVYRDNTYSTKIVPLSNIVNYKGEQVRKDAKYYKQYLEGRYGADPFIKKGLDWNE